MLPFLRGVLKVLVYIQPSVICANHYFHHMIMDKLINPIVGVSPWKVGWVYPQYKELRKTLAHVGVPCFSPARMISQEMRRCHLFRSIWRLVEGIFRPKIEATKVQVPFLGGGCTCFFFHPLFGEDSHLDKYFSNGLIPPTSLVATNLGLTKKGGSLP